MKPEKERVRTSYRRSLAVSLLFHVVWAVMLVVALFAGVAVDVLLIAAVSVLLWVPLIVERFTKEELPLVIQVSYGLFLTMSSVMGSALGVYGAIASWDSWAHLYSGVVLGWVGLFVVRIVERQTKAELPQWFSLCVAVMTALALGAIWEVGEFMSDRSIGTTTQFGLEDTIVDMAAAGVGAGIVVVAAVWLRVPQAVMPRALGRRE